VRQINAAFVTAAALVYAGLLAAQNAPMPLPPVKKVTAKNKSLARDPSFEHPKSRAWRFSDWPPRPKTRDRPAPESIFYSQDVVHSGRWSICFDHTTVGPDRTLGVRQVLKPEVLAPFDGQRMRLSAWVWVARGPSVYSGRLTLRQWGHRGAPPISATTVRICGRRGVWTYNSREFTFRFGQTQRADVNVWFRSTPNPKDAPVCFLDDVNLEVLSDPAFAAESLGGQTVFKPDNRLPLRLKVSSGVWAQGIHNVRWDVTSLDGRISYAHASALLTTPISIVEAHLPALPDGPYAVRVALGTKPNERNYEVLIPFRLASGPFLR